MTIRVTSSLMVDRSIKNINKNMMKLQDLQLKLSTGRNINKPSDDPVGLTQVLKLKESVEESNQHQTNIDDGGARLTAAMKALSNVEDLILEIQSLASDYISSDVSASSSVLVAQLNGILDEMLLNANAQYMGKYLFGGDESLRQPYLYEDDGAGNITRVYRNRTMNGTDEIRGIDDNIYHTVSEGQDLPINISGSRPFMPNGEGNELDVFESIIQLRDAVSNNNLTSAEEAFDELQEEYENIAAAATILGERKASLDTLYAINNEWNVIKEENLSKILDVEYTETISQMTYQQFIYQTSLQVGARIVLPTLMEFI